MNATDGLLLAAIAVLVALTLVLVVSVARSRGRRRTSTRPDPEADTVTDSSRPRAAVIVNPTKFEDVEEARRRATQICLSEGWAEPLWLETTIEDPGTGQARQAREAGVDLVCPLGGDGTVRSIAAELVGTDTPVGLLPGGTGNLLARNLDLPVDSLEQALRVALTGRNDRIDVGTINVVVPGTTQDEPKDYYFLVMAGMGIDANVMADAPEKLKAKFGWPAYVVAGMKHLNGAPFGVEVSLDEGPAMHRRIRTVVVGNVGRLQGGIELLPEATADDGALDVVLLSPRGVLGWLSVALYLLSRARWGHPRIEHHRCAQLRIALEHRQEVQLDGDPIGPSVLLNLKVEPRSLVVRVAA